MSVESLLSKANKAKRPLKPEAWQGLWVRPSQEYLDQYH
jgi:hypothetical protein